MAGSFFREDHGEWNCICDPEATTIALRRSINHTLVGLDVTLRCTQSPAQVREHFAKPPCDVLLTMAEKFFQSADRLTFHDPLAAALIFQPELCRLREERLSVDARGHTNIGSNGQPHKLAAEVDVDGFFREYFGVVHA
jgi:purine nucleosidase